MENPIGHVSILPDNPITANQPLQGSLTLMHEKSSCKGLQLFDTNEHSTNMHISSPIPNIDSSKTQNHEELVPLQNTLMENFAPLPPANPFHLPTFVSASFPPNQDPLTWIERGLQGHASFFPMIINEYKV